MAKKNILIQLDGDPHASSFDAVTAVDAGIDQLLPYGNVAPEDVYVLNPTSRPTLTLVTCYPFDFIGHAPKRYIIKAELVTGAKAR